MGMLTALRQRLAPIEARPSFGNATPNLDNPKAFFAALRAGILGPTLDTGEVQGCNVLLGAFAGWSRPWCAYGLATAYHETAHTMQPVREYGGDRYFHRMYDLHGARPRVAAALGNIKPGDGVRFHGRGYAQITGRTNYARASHKLGVDLLGNPDLAMRPDLTARIIRLGMQDGWFTGRKLADYLGAPEATLETYIPARRIVNGTDRALLIAGYATQFDHALRIGGWRA